MAGGGSGMVAGVRMGWIVARRTRPHISPHGRPHPRPCAQRRHLCHLRGAKSLIFHDSHVTFDVTLDVTFVTLDVTFVTLDVTLEVPCTASARPRPVPSPWPDARSRRLPSRPRRCYEGASPARTQARRMNRSDRRRQLASLAKAPDAGQRFAADMAVATRLHKEGRLKEAVELYRKIVRVYDGLAEARVAWSNLGAGLLGLNKAEEGVLALKKARALKPDAPAPHHNLGMALLNLGRTGEAIESLGRAVALDPKFRDAWMGLGLACERAGHFGRAEEACRKALEADPGSLEARYNLANLLRNTGRHAEAAQELGRCIEARPDFAEAHFALGRAREAMDDLGGAATAYLESIRLAPAAEGLSNQMGLCLQRLAAAEPETAKDFARRWRTAAPDSSTARHMAAAILGETPARADDAFLRAQFDRFAPIYDQALASIGNRAPELLSAAVAAALPSPAGDLTVLDAGCGTGLLAPWLKPYAARLDGVDVSAGMVEQAKARGLYDGLEVAELTALLADRPGSYDLVAAGDVLPYFGDLAPVLAAVAGALRPGGRLAGTVEATDAADGFTLRPTGRYAHGVAHLRGALAAAGLTLESLATDTLRQERGEPVAGHVFVAVKG